MPVVLIVLVIVNDVLFAWLAIRSLRLAQRIRTRQARQQAYLVALVCTAFLVASFHRIGLQLVEANAFDPEAQEFLLGMLQLVLALAALFLVIPALYLLNRLTRSFATAERVVTAVTDQALSEGSLELADLTPREIEVTDLISTGVLSDEDLAERLFISPSTAGTHVKNILRKTGARNRRELMVLAAAPEIRR